MLSKRCYLKNLKNKSMLKLKQKTKEGYGTGALPSGIDTRAYIFAGPAQPFDWELGFDIEIALGYRAYVTSEAEFWGSRGREGWGVDRYREIVAIYKAKKFKKFKIPISNQDGSGSCTGQGLAKYISVLNFIETGVWVEISAKDIYHWVSSGYGAMPIDALDRAKKIGVATEALVPCYVNGKPQPESFYDEPIVVTPEIEASRVTFRTRSYNAVQNPGNFMDACAWAILMNFGMYFSVAISDNGKWSTEFPDYITYDSGHALYAGTCKIVRNNKFIYHPNSWGTNVGADGWQGLSAEFYVQDQSNPPWTGIRPVVEAYTLVDLSNDLNLRRGIILDFAQIEGEATVVIQDQAGLYYPIATPPELWPYVQKKYSLTSTLPKVPKAVVTAKTGGVAEVDVYLKSGKIVQFLQIEGESTIVIKVDTGLYHPIATPPELWGYVKKKYALPDSFVKVAKAVVEANKGEVVAVDVLIKSS